MRAMKKTVSVLLSLMLVLGVMTIGMSAVSATETNTITVTSDVAATKTVDYVPGTSEQVTVTFSLQANVPVLNFDGVITFDKDVLQIAATNTVDTAFPVLATGNLVANLTKTDGRLPFNSSRMGIGANGFDFSTKAVLATVVFNIIGSGDTTVDLGVTEMIGTTSATPTTSESDVVIIDDTTNDNTKYTAEADAVVTPEVEPELPGLDGFLYSQGLNLRGDVGLLYMFKSKPTGYTVANLSVSMQGPHEDQDRVVPYVGMTAYNYNLKAAYLSQPVTVTILNNGEPVAQEVMTLHEFVRDNPPSNEAARKLQYALLNYGARAQISKNYATDNLANQYIDPTLTPTTSDDIVVPEGVDDAAPALTNYGLSMMSEGAVLGSSTAITMNFRVTSANASKFANTTVTINGEPASFVQTAATSSTTFYSLTIPDIPAKDMDGIYEVKFTNGSNTATYKVSIVKYLKDRLAKNNNDDELCVSMYLYHIAAKERFGS